MTIILAPSRSAATTTAPTTTTLATLPQFAATPALSLSLTYDGTRTALVVTAGSTAHRVDLSDWPAAVVQLLRAHAARLDAAPLAAGDRVAWTTDRAGTVRAFTGTVVDVYFWRGRDEARVDTDPAGPHRVTTSIAAALLTRIGGS